MCLVRLIFITCMFVVVVVVFSPHRISLKKKTTEQALMKFCVNPGADPNPVVPPCGHLWSVDHEELVQFFKDLGILIAWKHRFDINQLKSLM